MVTDVESCCMVDTGYREDTPVLFLLQAYDLATSQQLNKRRISLLSILIGLTTRTQYHFFEVSTMT